MGLQFAFAVNNDNQFEKRHFGDADKYLIYQQELDKLVLSADEVNQFKLLDEEVEHGSKKKGKAIIEFLKKKEVNVLVSRQFGKNIKLINAHFIPVIISSEKPDEVIRILTRHLHWIEDEWEQKKSNFKLFSIRKGILKSSIEK
jgi:predicted Fe-Mo cluster-binding NifX family protein